MALIDDALNPEFSEVSPPETSGLPTQRPKNILDPGFDLTLRPMRYPQFFDMYQDAMKNTWTVDEIDFSDDLVDLERKLMPAERHLIERLVAFFATGDSIVANNLVLNLYQHINATTTFPIMTSVPRRSLRLRTSRRFARRPSSALSTSTRSATSIASRLPSNASSSCSISSASQRASRACSSSRRSPTSTSCAAKACSTVSPLAPTGCSATRAPT